jgi:uncharacterized protein YbbC (DUF1343 family)
MIQARFLCRLGLAVLSMCVAQSALAAPPKLPQAAPEEVGMSSEKLAAIDSIVAQGLEEKKMPGCVVLVARRGKIVLLKAYGNRSVEPEATPMTTDTVFDMASITKPLATATSVMLLVEAGKLRLDDTVAKHWPEFGSNGKESITIEQLLTHQGGLIPDNSLADYAGGYEQSMQKVAALKPQVEPGTKFIYSDVSMITLAEVVRRLTGQDVHKFSQQHIFRPLGMAETGYLPAEPLKKRAAPTEEREGHWMQGEVHDPRAYRLGGIAGHAGLFSTATDLAVYAQMMHGRGEYGGVRIMKPETFAEMTTARRVSRGARGLGWDMRTGYSINRGEGFSRRAFGHGGFTGTVLWIDPELETTFIFLSNRVHPAGKGSVNTLAGKIGTVIAAAITDRAAETTGALNGIDVLERDRFALLKGRSVGLITNHTGINRQGKSTVELLRQAEGVKLVALFSPEHGFEGKLDVAKIADTNDPTSGLHVYSLYGANRKPTKESLAGIDTLVFDIQDVGARYYTYSSTMGHALEVCAEHGLRFVVLDRPNPINGVDVAGPVLDEGKESFVGFHAVPVRHGMTLGELARLIDRERDLKADLHVVEVEGWRRADFFDATNLLWVNPSPNMRSLTQAVLYPGIGLLETTNLSVGRGTDTPFEVVGAPWIDARRLAAELNAAGLAGVRFVPIEFMPDSSKFKDERCGGVNIIVTGRSEFLPVRTGLTIAVTLRRLYPDAWDMKSFNRLLASDKVFAAVQAARPVAEIEALYQEELAEFLKRRQESLLYD